MSLQIRRYHQADHAQVLHLHKVALEAVSAYAAPGPWDDDLDDIERNYLGTGGKFLVGVLGADLSRWARCEASMRTPQNSNA